MMTKRLDPIRLRFEAEAAVAFKPRKPGFILRLRMACTHISNWWHS